MAIPLYLTTIEQDIFDTFRYLPHAVAVGVGFVTVAAAWKNRQMIKKQKRLEHAHAVPGTQLLLWFLVAVIFFLICFSDLQMPFGIHISSFGGILILFRTHLDLLNYNTNKLLAQWLKS